MEIEGPSDTTTNTRKIEIWKIWPEHPVSPEDPNQAQLQLENPGYIDSISPDISRQQTIKIKYKMNIPGIPVIPGIISLLLLLLLLLSIV